MKILFRLLFALSLVSFLPVQASDDDHDDDDHDEAGELHESMEEMGDLYKALSKGLRSAPDAANIPTYLEQISEIQENILEAKEEVPPLVQKIEDPSKRAEMEKDFRLQMSKLLISSCELEIALLEGNLSEAAEMLKEMKSQKSHGHDQFMEEDD